MACAGAVLISLCPSSGKLPPVYAWDQTLYNYRNWASDFLHWPALKFLHSDLEGSVLFLPDPSWHPAVDLSVSTCFCACIPMTHSTYSWRSPSFSWAHSLSEQTSLFLSSSVSSLHFPHVRFPIPEFCLPGHWASSCWMLETSVSGCCRWR